MTCGVYQIINTVTGKVYVGSSKNVGKRRAQHFSQLQRGVHHSKRLANSLKIHGIECFSFEVLEECEETDLLTREFYWICTKNSVKNGYNTRFKPETNLGIKHSDESKRNMSEAHKGYKHTPEARENYSKASKLRGVAPSTYQKSADVRRGKPLPEETRVKIAAALAGKAKSPEHVAKVAAANLGTKRSDETKRRISEVQKDRKLSPEHVAKLVGRKATQESIEKRMIHLRGVAHSQEHIDKRVAARKETMAARPKVTRTAEYKAKMRQSLLGRVISPESIAKAKATRAANKLAKLAEDQKAKYVYA